MFSFKALKAFLFPSMISSFENRNFRRLSKTVAATSADFVHPSLQSHRRYCIMQDCQFGESCTDYKCKFSHPPSWWVCDYGPLCFVAGCLGVHPPPCKQLPCQNIRHCNLMHLKACEHGAACLSPNCGDLHPPPCENPSCNGLGCVFTHPHNPKYQHIISLNRSGQGNQQQQQQQGGGQQKGQTPKKQAQGGNQWVSPNGAAPSNFNPPPQNFNVPCRFAPNCTKYPNCPYLH
jgi:hypothetical protein